MRESDVPLNFDGVTTMSGNVNKVQVKFKGKKMKNYFLFIIMDIVWIWFLVDLVGTNNRIAFEFFASI